MKTLLKTVSLLLVAFLLGAAFMACGKKGNDGGETKPAGEVVQSNPEVGFDVAPTNWEKDFTVLAPAWASYREFFFDDEETRDTGDPIDMALYARSERIKSHLGVTLKHNVQGTSTSDFKTSFDIFKQMISSGDDVYQLYQTHTYINVAAMATQGYACDLKLFEDINLDADYWNKEAMEELEINSSLYYGLSDYMLADPNAVFFNKTMQENYKIRNPYEMVRDGTWTLENMIVESMKVADQGDKATKNLGFASPDDWYFLSLIDSCDTQVVVDEGGYKTVNMSAANERYAGVYDQLEDLFGADSSLVYQWQTHDEADNDKSISSGRVLFTFVPLHKANTYRKTEVKFGILPYPKYDVDQKEYRSFDWSGLMCVPVTVQNVPMVGQVLECLSYFSANGESSVHNAYYENLLGAKLADAPDDYEMLRMIYDGVVTNCAINMIEGNGGTEARSEGLNKLVYCYSNLAKSYSRGTAMDGIATLWASNGSIAQSALDKTVNS